jgi:hypothetical protein
MSKFTSSKDKDKPLQDKLKTFFTRRKGQGSTGFPKNTFDVFRITEDVREALDATVPFPERARAMKEIVENLHGRRIEDVSFLIACFASTILCLVTF